MRAVLTHIWKEWREHRAVLLGIAIAIPLLTLAAFIGLASHLSGLGFAAPAFVAGAMAIAALALSTELIAGESSRGTLGFLRRQPSGLALGSAAKTGFYLLIVILAGVWAAMSFLTVASCLNSGRMASDAWHALTRDPLTWQLSLLVLVSGAWILMTSTWVTRGAAAAGLAAILVVALGFPGFLLWGEHPRFLDRLGVGATGFFVGLGLLAFATASLGLVRGHRFLGGSWAAAWRGLIVVGIFAVGGYAHAAQQYHSWAHIDPADPEARIWNGYLGRGARVAYITLGRENEQGSERPVCVDVETGTWRDLGPAGAPMMPTRMGVWGPGSPFPAQGCGLLEIWPSSFVEDSTKAMVTYVDGATGAVIGRFPGRGNVPELLAKQRDDLRLDTPVKHKDGRRAWILNGKLERESPDGTIESRPLPPGITGGWTFPWGWFAYQDNRRVTIDAWEEGTAITPIHWQQSMDYLPNWFPSPTWYLERRREPKTRTSAWTEILSDGVRRPATGFEPDDVRILCCQREQWLVWNEHVVPGKQETGFLVRIDPVTRSRTVVSTGPGIPAVLGAASIHGMTSTGMPILSATTFDGEAGYMLYDATSNSLVKWTPAPIGYVQIMGSDGPDTALALTSWLRLERIHWGSPLRDVVFPRRDK